MKELGFETMLGRDLFDERLCRFVQGFHCHGKMYPILMLSQNSMATVNLNPNTRRWKVHGLQRRLGLVPQVTHLQNSIPINTSSKERTQT